MTSDVVLTNLRIWDGIADSLDPVHDAIELRNGRIHALAESRNIRQANTRDMSGMFVIPGLMDAHVHMCLDPDERDPFAHGKRDDETLLTQMAGRGRQMLAAGITTARDLGGGRWLELKLRDAINQGLESGPRLLCAGQPITSTGGHCHFWGGEAANLPEALAVLARQVAHDVDLIKIMATGGNITPGSSPRQSQFDGETLAALVAEARRCGCAVATHCHGTEGIGYAARAGVTTIEHCSWVGETGWGQDYDPVAVTAMVANGCWVSPTINAGWRRFMQHSETVSRVQGNLSRLQAAGVKLVASTDAGIPGVFHHDLPRALPVFAFFAGMDNAATLRSATSECARALGIADQVGQLRAGYAADMVFYETNPLDDLAVLETPSAVMARGQFVDLAG